MLKKIYNDIGEKWGMGMQEEATPIAAGIVDLHNYLMYYLIIIFIFVSYIIYINIYNSTRMGGKTFDKKTGGTVNGNWVRYVNHSHKIELIWTIIPAIILVIIAIPSFKLLYSLEADDLMKPSVTLKITGNQWFWNYEISDVFLKEIIPPEDWSEIIEKASQNGTLLIIAEQKEKIRYTNLDINFDSYTKSDSDLNPGELRLLDVDNRVLLPVNTPIRLLITAQDVIHSFAVPSFGIKMDAVPGRINHSSLFILKPGVYYGQCSELCGSAHENMSIVIEGTSLLNYIKWLSTFLTE